VAREINLSNDIQVTKANTIIEARYKLTLMEQKLILIMASMIQPEDIDFRFYKVSIKDMAKFLSMGSVKRGDIYHDIRRVIDGLNSGKKLSIPTEKGILDIYWVASAEYNFEEGTVEFEFSQKLKPYLLQLKKAFTTYKLKNVIQLKSSYSIRVYELLKQYERLGKRKIEIEKLKEILGVGKKYKLYGDLKRKVLEVAREELPKKSDIAFDYREIKTGRKVSAIEFFNIRLNIPTDPETGQITFDFPVIATEPSKGRKRPAEVQILPLTDVLISRGVSEKQAFDLLEEFGSKKTSWSGQEYSLIEFQIEHYDWLKKNGVGENRPKKPTWLIRAIQEDWRPSDNFKTKAQAEASERKKAKFEVQKKVAQAKQREEEDKNTYEIWVGQSLEERWQEFSTFKQFENLGKKDRIRPTQEQMMEIRVNYFEKPETPEEYQLRKFGKIKFSLPKAEVGN